MSKSFQIGNRRVEWVHEEPGVLLILLIALSFIFIAKWSIGAADEQPASEVEAHSEAH